MKRMRFYFLWSALISLSLICSSSLFLKNIDNSYAILDLKGNPSANLLRLLSLLEINHDGSLQSIVNSTQKAWIETIRPNTTERWEIDHAIKQKFEKNREELISIFSQLGLCQKLTPRHNHYTYGILLGSRLVNFCYRLAYFLELHATGVECDSLVLLAGERPLMQEENEKVFLEMLENVLPKKNNVSLRAEFPTNEADMMAYVIACVAMPESLKSSLIIIRSPMKLNGEGVLVRPTTGDTVKQWLQSHPTQGSILAISSQPYSAYQHAVLKTFLPDFPIETVGQAANDDIDIVLYLDTLARTVYQENIRLNS